MLAVTQLTKRFAGVTVFEAFDLRVPRNGFTVLVGPSGCGKSTLFDVLSGIVPKDSGEISWLGEACGHLGGKAAYMQQKDLLLPWLTLLENTMLPAVLGPGRTGAAQRRTALDLLQRLGLKGFEHYLPARVSGGMRQRCALVRTLMFEHELVLLDEPLSALDAITRRSLQAHLLLLQTEFAKTLLMITHDVEEALLLADELIVLTAPPMRVRERFVLRRPKPRRMDDRILLEIKGHVLAELQKDLADGLG